MTVVVKDADQKMLRQISGEGKVKPDDVEDFIAIINPSEAGILAISSAREEPVVESGTVKVGWPLSRESHHLR